MPHFSVWKNNDIWNLATSQPSIKLKESKEWQQTGIDQLKESCRYLINQRGFEEWKI